MLQADAYGGYNDLYRAARDPGPVSSALCWAHARRKFFELADITGNLRKGKPARQISLVALEAMKRIGTIFDIERTINGLDAIARLAARQDLSRPLVDGLHDWLQEERAKLSRHNKVAEQSRPFKRAQDTGRERSHLSPSSVVPVMLLTVECGKYRKGGGR